MECSISSAFMAITAILLTASRAAASNEVETLSGGLGSRSALSGDWGGLRTSLLDKGVALDLSLTQVGQGAAGGKDGGWKYGGRGDLVLNVDTGKLGLWPGGTLSVEIEGNFGDDVNSLTGALMEVNSNQLYPSADAHEVNVPELMFTQLLFSKAGVIVGKVDTGTDANELASGKGDTRFFNIAFAFNAAALLTIPYSALGVGALITPSGDPKEAVLKLLAVDANGKASTAGFDTAFEGNTTFIADARVRTNMFGLEGHQLLGISYSTKQFTALSQDSRLVLEDRSIQMKESSWCVYYNFDQYLYMADTASNRGAGVFGRFGVSDGDPNPVKYFFSLGLGGRGAIPGRSLDAFGVGYYLIIVGHPTFTGPFATRSFLRDEQGFEAYYAIAVAPWLMLTPDIQIIKPAQRLAVDASTGDSSGLKSVSTATALGLRLRLIL